MKQINKIVSKGNSNPTAYSDEITLPFETRQKSRFKTTSHTNTEIGFFLERGHILRDGDLVSAEDGTIFKISAANETVSTIYSKDALLLTKAAYHLGNRHVPLQIGEGWIRIQHDHVLEEMVERLGLSVEREQAPFEPEPGAYGGENATHSHGHSHEHTH